MFEISSSYTIYNEVFYNSLSIDFSRNTRIITYTFETNNWLKFVVWHLINNTLSTYELPFTPTCTITHKYIKIVEL